MVQITLETGEEQSIAGLSIRVLSISPTDVTLQIENEENAEADEGRNRHALRNELFALQIAIDLIRDELTGGDIPSAVECVQQALDQLKVVQSLSGIDS